MLTTTLNLKHTRSPKTVRSFINRKMDAEAVKRLEVEEFGGMVVKFSRPFGVDYYISLFEGEGAYLVSIMGGHFMSFSVMEMEVDGPAKVLFNEYTADRGKKTREETGETNVFKAAKEECDKIVVEFAELLEDELPREVFKLLQKDGCFKKSNEEE